MHMQSSVRKIEQMFLQVCALGDLSCGIASGSIIDLRTIVYKIRLTICNTSFSENFNT